MKTKILFTVKFLLLGFLNIQSQSQEPAEMLSLKKTLQIAVDKNTEIRNADLEKQKSVYQLKETQSKLYPQIEAYSDFSYYYSIPKMVIPGEIFGQSGMIAVEIGTKYDWSNGFKATQVLYNQSYFTSLKIARQMMELNNLSLQQKKEEIVYQVAQLYFLCQTTVQQIELLKISLQNSDKLEDIAKLQQENGIIRKVDYSRVVVNKLNLQTQIDNLQQLHKEQLGLLKYLIGYEISADVILTDSLTPDISASEMSLQPDMNNRPELQLLDKQIECSELSLKANRQKYLPSLAGFGQYYYQGQRNEFDFLDGGNDRFYKVGVVGFSLNIPITDGFEKRAVSSQKKIEIMQLQNTRQSTLNFLSKEYEDALRKYTNNRVAMDRQQENIRVAEETYDASLQGYQQQVIPLSDLLMAESSLIETRLSYLNALLQLKEAELDLKRSKGELLNYITEL